MMMQSGMVKQSVDFTSSIKAFDGTIIEQGLLYPKKICYSSLSSLFEHIFFFLFNQNQNHQMLNVFYC